MTGLSAVVARELQEWKRVFAAALAAGFLVYLTPLLPTTRSYSALQTMNAAAGFIAAAFAIGVALIAGGGCIGRELSERRFTFYFFKPLSTGSIYGGKLLGAVLLAFFSAILALVPVTLAGGGLLTLGDESPRKAFAILASSIIVVVILSNSFSLSLRARSRWVLMDFGALLVVTAMLAAAGYPLGRHLAFGLVRVLGAFFLLFFVFALVIAGFRGLQWGRTELREVHRIHALTVWPICLAVAAGLIGYSAWVRASDPRDLHLSVDQTAPSGPWLALSGESPLRADYRPTFLTNVDRNESLRIGGSWRAGLTVSFSRDGHHAVWLDPTGLNPAEANVIVAKLQDKPAIRETRIFTNPQLSFLAMSPDGSRLGLTARGVLTVFDLATEQALASVRVPRSKRNDDDPRMVFVDQSTVRLFRETGAKTVEIYEFDVDERSMRRTGAIETSRPFQFVISSNGETLRVNDADHLSLHNGRTGELLFEALPAEKDRRSRGMLFDGRVVMARAANGRGTLQVFDSRGEVASSIDLGPAGSIRLGGEVSPGKLVVAVTPTVAKQAGEFQKNSAVLLVELGSGAVRKVADRLSPVPYLWRHEGPPAPGSGSTKIFLTADSTLVYFDPVTGARRLIGGVY